MINALDSPTVGDSSHFIYSHEEHEVWINNRACFDINMVCSYSFLVQTFTTGALFLLNFTKGLMFSIPGPTLLALIASTTIGRSTWIFFFRGCGVVTGSVLGGYALGGSRCRTLALCVNIVVVSLTFGAIPWSTDVVYMYILFTVHGLSYGCISATMNYFMLQLWDGEANSPLVFSAAIACVLAGATIAPVIGIPFLPNDKHEVLYQLPSELNQGNMTPTSAGTTNSGFHSPSYGNITNDFSYTDAPLANLTANSIPSPSDRQDLVRELYFIITACGLFSALVVTVGSVLTSHVGLANKELSESREGGPVVDAGLSRVFFVIFCLLYEVFLFGMEIVFVGLIASYMVEGLGCSQQEGTLITSLFWGVYTVVVLLGIGLARSLTPSTLLLFSNTVITAGAFTLLCGYDSRTLVWIGTALLAVGFGPTYANIFLWGDYYISLTRALTGVFVAAPEIGGIIMPTIEGQLFSHHPGSLMVMVFVLCIASDVIYILTESIAFPFQRKANETTFGWKKPRALYYDTLN